MALSLKKQFSFIYIMICFFINSCFPIPSSITPSDVFLDQEDVADVTQHDESKSDLPNDASADQSSSPKNKLSQKMENIQDEIPEVAPRFKKNDSVKSINNKILKLEAQLQKENNVFRKLASVAEPKTEPKPDSVIKADIHKNENQDNTKKQETPPAPPESQKAQDISKLEIQNPAGAMNPANKLEESTTSNSPASSSAAAAPQAKMETPQKEEEKNNKPLDESPVESWSSHFISVTLIFIFITLFFGIVNLFRNKKLRKLEKIIYKSDL